MAGHANNPADPGATASVSATSASRAHTQVTQLLVRAGDGDARAREQLWCSVYTELKKIAASQLAAEHDRYALAPTVLVHEAFLRLAGASGQFENRQHFFAAAARAMRCIRIDDARRRTRKKRGGGEQPKPLWSNGRDADEPIGFDDDPNLLLAVDEVLDRLRDMDPRKHQVVELRYFAGLTVDETAAAMGISPRTVNADWRFARAWLHRELSGT